MAVPQNGYTTLATLRAAVSLASSDTADDTKLQQAIEDASRLIDEEFGVRFYPRIATRYYTATNPYCLMVDQLLAVTSLKTDEDGDRTYEITWATTDYDLDPANAADENPPRPYEEIRVTPDGNYTFPRYSRGVQVIGKWGYYEVTRDSGATASEAMDASETGYDVSDGTLFEAGQIIKADSEWMLITAIVTNTLTVTRGYNGSTAATHSTAIALYILTFPVVATACLRLAAYLYRTKDTPFGVTGSADMGTGQIVGSFMTDLRRMLNPFRRVVVA